MCVICAFDLHGQALQQVSWWHHSWSRSHIQPVRDLLLFIQRLTVRCVMHHAHDMTSSCMRRDRHESCSCSVSTRGKHWFQQLGECAHAHWNAVTWCTGLKELWFLLGRGAGVRIHAQACVCCCTPAHVQPADDCPGMLTQVLNTRRTVRRVSVANQYRSVQCGDHLCLRWLLVRVCCVLDDPITASGRVLHSMSSNAAHCAATCGTVQSGQL
jgi:hypothetical protein